MDNPGIYDKDGRLMLLPLLQKAIQGQVILAQAFAQEVFQSINRIQGKSMLENKKLSDRRILYQFLRRIPISNRTIAYDIVDRDSNEKQDRKQVTTT